jgi:hypothetical protein
MIRFAPAALAVLLLAAPAAVDAQQDDEEWLNRCREQRSRRNQAHHCDVRVERFTPPGGPLRVAPGTNGGVAVIGWDQNQVEVHARVDARAATEADARALAERITISRDGGLRAEGPDNTRDESWHVQFVVYAPARSDLELATQNGPLSVRGVNGRMTLETQNGPLSLREVAGEVRARAENGPLSIVLSGSSWDGVGLDAETRNGPASITIPDGYNAQLETGTVNGPFTSDVPLTVTLRGRMNGPISATLGRGGPPIRVVTTNGPLQIRTR